MKSKRRIATLMFLLAGLFVTGVARADLTGAMDAMWNYTTPGQVYVPGRTGYDLGGLAFRSPTQSFQLVSLDAPRVSFGCGGIDIHGGSFSLISAAQFKQMIRQIAQNAPGYLMMMAINAMCPTCQALLSDLQNLMTSINSLKVNTCMSNLMNIGKQFSAAGDQISAAAHKLSDDWGTAVANLSDALSGDQLRSRNGGTVTAATGQDENDRLVRANANIGNTTYRLLLKSNVAKQVQIPGAGLTDQEMVELLMSLVGTQINRPAPPNVSESQAMSSTDPAQATAQMPSITAIPTITLMQLRDGGDNIPEVLHCQAITLPDQQTSFDEYGKDQSCQSVARGPMQGFKGVRPYVLKQLFGTTDAAQRMESFDPNSIGDVIVNGGTLTQAQAQFLGAGYPGATQLLVESQSINGTLAAAKLLVDPIANNISAKVGAALIKGIRTGINGLPPSGDTPDQTDPNAATLTPSPFIQSSLQQIEKEYWELRKADEDTPKKMIEMANAISQWKKFFAPSRASSNSLSRR